MPKVGVVMDSIESINLKKDSTLAMIRAVQLRGWSVHYMEQSDLYFREDRPWAFTRRLNLAPEVIADLQSALSNPLWYELQGTVTEPLGEFDIILMRKDPPFDLEYVYTTYLLERAEQEGALVVNRPQSLRDCNEKFFATEFPECTPPLVISRRDDVLREFHREQGDVIFKPLGARRRLPRLDHDVALEEHVGQPVVLERGVGAKLIAARHRADNLVPGELNAVDLTGVHPLDELAEADRGCSGL